MRIGVQLWPEHTSFERLRSAWIAADQMGADSIWTWDHLFALTDGTGEQYEAWTTIAALGPQTRSAQIGCLVLAVGYRNPVLLSAMARTLDHALGGRLILGLGAGWQAEEHRLLGSEMPSPLLRLRSLEESICMIRARWLVDRPPPVRGTIPVLIGGGGERVTLRIAASHADMWNTSAEPREFARKSAVLNQWCERVGRDPREIQRTVSIVPAWTDRLDEFLEAGADEIVLSLASPFDLELLATLLDWRGKAYPAAKSVSPG